jgi:hypothetical protein
VDLIEGLMECVEEAEKQIQKSGIPKYDFKLFYSDDDRNHLSISPKKHSAGK